MHRIALLCAKNLSMRAIQVHFRGRSSDAVKWYMLWTKEQRVTSDQHDHVDSCDFPEAIRESVWANLLLAAVNEVMLVVL